MRVAIVSESFLPTLNGVTTSVRQVLHHLAANGHEAMVICPAAGSPESYSGFAVHEVPSVAYRQFNMGLPSPQVSALLADFAPDVLHAASPFLLGGKTMAAARRLGIPTVAIFQTDVAGYARRNHLGAAAALVWRLVKKVHDYADVTLAPSTASISDLAAAGIPNVYRWGRGVDLEAYHPRNRDSAGSRSLRARLAPNGETVVGYVGRVAPEKQLHRLAALRGLDGIRIAIVGDGPSMAPLRKLLDGMPVSYLGTLSGLALSEAYGAFDLFLTPGTEETFGQTIQEAHASGLAVVAPRTGGPIDLVDVGVDGYLYEPGDDFGLRELTRKLATDEPLRIRMGEAGRRGVLGRSWNAVCSELVAHYERAIAARAGESTPTTFRSARNRARLGSGTRVS